MKNLKRSKEMGKTSCGASWRLLCPGEFVYGGNREERTQCRVLFNDIDVPPTPLRHLQLRRLTLQRLYPVNLKNAGNLVFLVA